MTLAEYIAERRAIAEAATPGPWCLDGNAVFLRPANTPVGVVKMMTDADFQSFNDARNHIELLLAIIERQDEALSKMEPDSDDGGAEGYYGTLAKEARAQVAELLAQSAKGTT